MSNVFRFAKCRFHIEQGPKSLFDRVIYKFKDVTELKLHGSHYKLRNEQRQIPEEVIKELVSFNIGRWHLKQAEVRVDTGKFVNTTWELIVDDVRYWVVVGFNNVIETIIVKNSSGFEGIVTSGELYKFVDEVNRKLMDEVRDEMPSM